MNINIKEALYNKCVAFVEKRFETIAHIISGIQIALTSETKSSAGDKHETGRAMLHLEREKAGNQLAEVQKVKELLSKIDVSNPSSRVGLGSVVYTSNANYFIAISAGEFTIANKKYYAISAHTPIGKLLLSKTKGDQITFRAQHFSILEVI